MRNLNTGSGRETVPKQFSRRCVIFCLAMCTIITGVVLWRAELTAGTVGAIMGVWGGELLMLLVKRLLGDPSAGPSTSSAQADDDPPI